MPFGIPPAALAAIAGALVGGSRTQVTTTQAQDVVASVSPVITVVTGGGTVDRPVAGGSPTGAARATASPSMSETFPFFSGPGAFGPTRLPQTNDVESLGLTKADAQADTVFDFVKSPLGLAALGLGAWALFGGGKK